MTAAILNRPTLVLNRHWQPVRVAPLARALTLLAKGAARAVNPEDFQLYGWSEWLELTPRHDHEAVASPSRRVRAPEIVALIEFDRLPAGAVSFSKQHVYARDRQICQYCGCFVPRSEATLDHVIPRAQGGKTTWENCVLACVACNRHKADRTPQEARMKLRTRPTRPTWRPLFAFGIAPLASWSAFLGASASMN